MHTMLATLDPDSLHCCLSMCDLKSVYMIASCNSHLLLVSRAFLHDVQDVGDWCRTENVALILRDIPNVILPIIAPARDYGRRVDAKTFRMLQGARSTAALCHAGIDTMTARGLKYVLELPVLKHHVVIDKSPRWMSYLNTEIHCRSNELRLTIFDFKPLRIIRWLHLSSHVMLRSLDLCCDVYDMTRVVSLLPRSLETLSIQGQKRLQNSIEFITEILQRLQLLELRIMHCIFPSAYNCNFVIDVFRSELFRLPRVVGMDPFPVDAYRAALDRGCFICVCSSNFNNPYSAVADIESMGRAIFCTACR